MKTYQKKHRHGFTLIEILTTCGIIGLLAAIAIPATIRNRDRAAATACIENLTKIEAAKQQLATETGKTQGTPVVPSEIIGSSSYIKRAPVCPAGGTYDYMSVGTNATCTVTNSNPDLSHALP